MSNKNFNTVGVLTKQQPIVQNLFHAPVYILLVLLLLLFNILIAIPRIRGTFFQFDDFALLPTFSNMGLFEHFLQAPFGQYRPFTHWFLGIQFQAFGWQYPGLFALVSLVLHMGNSILLFFLLQFAQIRPSIALFASACFLFAPCTNEAYLWLTCQFDLLCVLFGLGSALAVVAFAQSQKLWLKIIFLSINFVGLLLALFSKEPAIIFPLLGGFILFERKNSVNSLMKNSLILFFTSLAAVSIFLIIRSKILDLGSTHYGSTLELYKNTDFFRNILLFLQSLFQLTFVKDIGGYRILSIVGYGILLIPFILGCIRLKKSWTLTLALIVSLILVAPLGIIPSSAAGGRLLYVPNIFFLSICALGLNFFLDLLLNKNIVLVSQNHKIVKILLLIFLAFWISVSISSTREVMNLWNLASGISKRAIESYIQQVPAQATHVFVQGLPQNLFLSNRRLGPWILKCYAFRYYPVKEVTAANRCFGYPISLLSSGKFMATKSAQLDYFSDYRTSVPNEVKIKLRF